MNIETPKEYEDSFKHLISKYEEDRVLIFNEKDLLSSLAFWSVKQSPSGIPRNLEIVLDKYKDHIKPYFDKLNKEDLGFIEMDLKTLKKFIRGNLITIKEFQEWNLSELELKNGISIDDEGRGEFCNQYITAFDEPDIMYDFIDLDALVRNVSYTIYDENEKTL
jgi:hypothetical protein